MGSVAPDFTLRSSAKEEVTLSSFRGKKNVLLAFYPLAFTGTCTKEMCAFTDDYSQFESQDTVVLPISVDSTDTLREYKAKYHMPYEHLSDFKREVSRLYGVLNDEEVLRQPRLFHRGSSTESSAGPRQEEKQW